MVFPLIPLVLEIAALKSVLDGTVAAHGDNVLVRDFSTVILRGDRIGLIGPNGSGKTTLLKLLLGDLQPQSGEVRAGTNLQIAYFDQHRSQLDDTRTTLENVAEGSDFVEINGSRKHVIGYLQDFLFSPERARAPITRLSGGERNRLLLAKLFAQPSNLLVMDEPTNDLDVETLELLEELLLDYKGTLLLVSHDRDFLDNVVTSTLVFEGEGKVREYVGGYQDWLRQGGSPRLLGVTESKSGKADLNSAVVKAEPAPVAAEAAVEAPAAKKKLSYKLQRELEMLPGQIEAMEQQIAAVEAQMADAGFYLRPAAETAAVIAKLEQMQAELDVMVERWAELDA